MCHAHIGWDPLVSTWNYIPTLMRWNKMPSVVNPHSLCITKGSEFIEILQYLTNARSCNRFSVLLDPTSMRHNEGREDNGPYPTTRFIQNMMKDLSMRTRIILTILHASTCDITVVDAKHVIFMLELGTCGLSYSPLLSSSISIQGSLCLMWILFLIGHLYLSDIWQG